ncbi:G-protein coupled receptor Mth2-like [Formica exsecta]|uniref:G-protein coupled receptor Mth2-like n=1 Tax=Formica exsecta TaxID=72781 RepID=UPI0011436C11|nr:G-protein coupled receptor Mth2-like [Formica exsecta]
MCGKNLAFWYCALFLFVASSSKSQQNFTNNTEKNDNLTVRYEIDADFTTNYNDDTKTPRNDLYKKSDNDTQYEDTQYESRTTSMSNDRKDDDSMQIKLDTHSIQNEDDKQILMEPRTNSSNANHKKYFASQEIYENLMRIEAKNDSTLHEFYENSSKDSNISNIIPYEMCYNITCIQLCCPLGNRLIDDECLSEENKYFFPNVYGYTNDSWQSENKTVDKLFQLVVYDPCQDEDRYRFPDNNENDYMFFANGSLYLSYYEIFAKSTSYCLAVVDGDKYEVITCSKIFDEIINTTTHDDISSIEDDDMYHFDDDIINISSNIVSISLLVPMFLVYSILPELWNVHGFMLCNYSGALSIAYTIDIVDILSKISFEADAIHYSVCITFAFFIYFCYLASFFWLSIMSFDMWWTFRGFSSLQGNVRKREKRKLVFYTIFAWGLSCIFAIITVIMDFVPGYLPEILRPKFRIGCWFAGDGAFALYFYGFKSICTVSSICLSISTSLKIARYKKEISNRLTNSESKRFNDNRKWFSLYLKLFILHFIIMGISWSMNTVYLLSETSYYYMYVIYLMDTMQNLCIFIIFVWKKNIKRMLLKRFGCGLFPQD